jgi:hypothetical protein
MYLNHGQRIWVTLVLLLISIVWEANGIYLAAFAQNHILLYWLADIFQWVMLPIMLITLLAEKASIFPKHYGLDTSALRWQSLIARTMAMFISAGLAFHWATQLSWYLLGHPTGYFNFLSAYPTGVMHTVVWLYSSIAVGIVESIFFIGLPWLLYQNVQFHPSMKVFSVLTSVIFAATHWEQGPHAIVGAFCFSLVACYWYFRFGTLWPVAAGHALVDLVAFA